MVNSWASWRRRRWWGERATGAVPDRPAIGDVAAEAAVPASDQAITIGGAPARLLSIQCQGLSIETAITIHAGKAIVFTSQLSSGTRADRAAFRRFLTGIRFQQ
jgi:hypothetical protein